MVHSPVYQIDFTVVASGKHIAASKRRIRWRWGLTNQDALAAGLSSTACRGEEHDVTVVWSIVSGKCNVLADGQEVHVSNSRSGSVTCSWTMKGNHVLQIVVHALSPQAPMRQYELLVDGQSFFEMPKVFHLGLQGGAPHAVSPTDKALPVAVSNRYEHNTAPYSNYSVLSNPYSTAPPQLQQLGTATKSITDLEAPRNTQEEEVFLAEAIRNSLQEQAAKNPPMAISPHVSKNENLILNFFEDAPPPPSYVAAPPPSYDGFHYQENQATPATVSPVPMQLFSSPQPVAPPVPPQPFQQQPPFVQTTAYPSLSSNGPFYKPPMNQGPSATVNFVATQPAVFAPPPPFMAPTPSVPSTTSAAPALPPIFSSPSPATQTKGLGKDANQAFEKFANMDLLGTSKRANPFDTASNGPSLSSLAEMNAGKTATHPPALSVQTSNSFDKKPIMKSTVSPPSGSMMVVSNQQQGNWGGYGGGPNVHAGPTMMQQPFQQAPILGHGYSPSGYAGYSSYGGPAQPPPQPQPVFQTPMMAPQQQQQQQQQQQLYGQGFAGQPPKPNGGNPW